jgi:hypothetical protein
LTYVGDGTEAALGLVDLNAREPSPAVPDGAMEAALA